MDNMLEYYVQEHAPENFLVPREQVMSRFFHGLRMEVNQNMGRGWSEILCIHNGLYVEIADFRLKHRMEARENMQPPFHLSLLLSGHFEFQIPEGTKQSVGPGDIWFVHAPLEQELSIKLPDENISTVSIGLPQDMVESWLDSSCGNASKGLEKLMFGSGVSGPEQQAFPLIRGLQRSSALMGIGRELVYARRNTIADNLRFESLALDLLSQILTLGHPGEDSRMERMKRSRAAVDETVDILRREWNDPPTISTLSRRVGVNECSLKKGFRKQMGMPIGAYIRHQRMKKALELIETGRYSILDTALFVGYSNPSHFSAAFRKFYGHLPSYYLPRTGKM